MYDREIKFLIAELNNKEYSVRIKAAQALGEFGTAAVPALIEALQSKVNVGSRLRRLYASEVLGEIGDESAIPTLLEALKDQSYDVCNNACIALGRIGDVSVVPALLNVLVYSPNNSSWHAVQALQKLGDPPTLRRKILTFSGFSVKQKVEVLESLSQAPYRTGVIDMSCFYSDTRSFCQSILREDDVDARENDRQILN